MPRVELPSTPTGWVITLAAAMIGFVSGFLFLRIVTGGGQ